MVQPTDTQKVLVGSDAEALPALHEVLRDRRIELGLTQLEVADAIGMGTGEGIGMMEKGIRKPDFARVPLYAAVLKINSRQLVKLALREQFPFCYAALFSGEPEILKSASNTKVSVDHAAAMELWKKINMIPSKQRQTVLNMIDIAVKSGW